MGKLNCKRASRNVPLFVAGDLSGDLDREVINHLAICEECGRLAQEFRESNSLLAEACALPEFGAQFYDEIRNNVLDKITRDGMSSRPRFGRRWIFASAFALILVASAVMFVRWRAAREAPQELSSTPRIAGNRELNQEPKPKSSLQSTGLPPKSPRAAITQKPTRRMTLPRPTFKQFESARNLDASPGGPQVSPSERASVSEVSRIEIQTSNPNIRIIWLVAADKRGAQEDNQNKGEPEPRTNDR
ncbi:MAG TPA: hypothetical protein DC054_05015 [Blastocatellia bacterium]|nr:hypothetical protein [Blastocatellia bacterium]